MRRVQIAISVVFVLTLLAQPPRAVAQTGEPVDLELVFLADASGSIDNAEIQFQRQGYAAAITHPQVLNAIADGLHQRIALAYVEWGDADSQDLVVPWTIIDGSESARAFAAALLAAPRRAFGYNAIGTALITAQALIEGNDIAGLRKVIDISADSANNWDGISIADARASVTATGITINGLAILCREDACGGRPVLYDVEAAFAKEIIGGPGAFVVTADGRDSFAESVRKKMVLEIADHEMQPAADASTIIAAN